MAKNKTTKEGTETAWTIVRRENMELRTSHPKVYRWARAYIDQSKEEYEQKQRRTE
jgi:hypothetical protein